LIASGCRTFSPTAHRSLVGYHAQGLTLASRERGSVRSFGIKAIRQPLHNAWRPDGTSISPQWWRARGHGATKRFTYSGNDRAVGDKRLPAARCRRANRTGHFADRTRHFQTTAPACCSRPPSLQRRNGHRDDTGNTATGRRDVIARHEAYLLEDDALCLTVRGAAEAGVGADSRSQISMSRDSPKCLHRVAAWGDDRAEQFRDSSITAVAGRREGWPAAAWRCREPAAACIVAGLLRRLHLKRRRRRARTRSTIDAANWLTRCPAHPDSSLAADPTRPT